MREQSRVFGNNLRYYMNRAGMNVEELAEKLGYSVYEIQQVMDARLFLESEEKEQMAELLGVTVDALYNVLDDRSYEQAGCMECRGKFSTAEYKREILDLFDAYCDVQETLLEEGLKSSV